VIFHHSSPSFILEFKISSFTVMNMLLPLTLRGGMLAVARRVVLCLVVLSVLGVGRAWGQPGLDATFDPLLGFPSGETYVKIQPDGKIIVAGAFPDYQGVLRNNIARLNADASLDNTFAVGTGITGSGLAGAVIQNDGKVIVFGGPFTQYDGQPCNNIARINTNGSFDATYNIGIGFDGFTTAAALQADGKLIVTGVFFNYGGTPRKFIARLNTDGTLDGTFDPLGSFDGFNYPFAVAVQPNGKILVGGDFTTYQGQPASKFIRLNSDGSIDATFNTGLGFDANVQAIMVQPNGTIIVTGNFTQYNGTLGLNNIVRLNADGTIDPTFNGGGGFNGVPYTLSLQSDGKIIVGGNFSTYQGFPRNFLARLNSDGSLDATFSPTLGANNIIYSTAIQSDGKILLGGQFTTIGGTTRNRIARVLSGGTYTWNGSISTDWQDPANWTPARTTPAVNDALIFPSVATTIVRNIPTQTIGELRCNTVGTFANRFFTNSPVATLTVTNQAIFNNGAGNDFNSPITSQFCPTCVLNLDIALGATLTTNSANLIFGTGALRIAGTATLNSSSLYIYRADGVNGTSAGTGTIQLVGGTGSINYVGTKSVYFPQGGRNDVIANLAAVAGKPALNNLSGFLSLATRKIIINSPSVITTQNLFANNMVINSGVSVTATLLARILSDTVRVLGALNVAAASFDIDGGASLELKDAGVYTGPAPTYNTGSKLIYSGSGNKIIGNEMLPLMNSVNITFQKSSGTVTFPSGTAYTLFICPVTIASPVIGGSGGGSVAFTGFASGNILSGGRLTIPSDGTLIKTTYDLTVQNGGILEFVAGSPNAAYNGGGSSPIYQSGSTLLYSGIGNMTTGDELLAPMTGNVRASNSGTLSVPSLTPLTMNGSLTVDVSTTFIPPAAASTTLNGAFFLNGTLDFPAVNPGTLFLNGPLTLNGSVRNSAMGNDIFINGSGSIDGALKVIGNTWKGYLFFQRPAAKMRLASPVILQGIAGMQLENGFVLQTDTNNMLSFRTGAPGNQYLNSIGNSYIEGPLEVTFPTITSPFRFPVGKNSQYLPVDFLNTSVGGNAPTFRVEAFTGGTGGRADGTTVSSLDTNQYWNVQLRSGDLLSTNIRLSQIAAIPAGSIIAKSPTATGTYTRLPGGTIATAAGFPSITAGPFSSFSTFTIATPYIPPPLVPSISSFSPLQTTGGTTTGGTSIILRGANFTNVQSVSIGGVPVQSFRVDSANQVTVTVPVGLASGAITIQTALGTATSTNPLTIVGAPTVTGISPSVVGAGTQVIITGTNFIPAPAGNASGAIPVTVRIGGVTASSVIVLSPTQIIATFPLGAGGQALSGQPVVQAWGGSGVGAQTITIIPPPIVNAFSPSTLAGGEVLTVTGANFVQPMTVRIGNLVLNVTVNSPTRATMVLPQGQTLSQTVTLTVSTPGGTATAGTVSIIGQPSISSLSPVAASPGETVTISGVNLTNVQQVFFGTTPASFRTDAQGRIIALVPANVPPNTPLSLTVQTRGGTATATQAFTPRPVQGVAITGISPLTVDEGARIDIAGINFPTNATVGTMVSSTTFTITIGGVSVTQVIVRSSSSLTVTLPAGLLSLNALSTSATVVMTMPEGTAIAAVPITVRALNPPSLTSISDVSGGTQAILTIVGANFGIAPRGGVLGVFVGGLPVGGFRVISPTQIVIEPLGTVTSGTVTVLTSAGTLTLTQSASGGQPVLFRFTPNLQPYVTVQASDSLALAALYQATGGNVWRDGANWLTEAVSSWRGVRIDSGRVVEVRLAANNLRGVLPVNELRQLTGLRVLDIGDNVLTGDISSLLGSLRNLRILRLSNNALTGSLDGLCGMANLGELDLAGCGMTGSLSVFCCLSRIERMNISRNQFTGAIPPCFGDKQILAVLDASNNQLSGALPASLGNAASLETLNLSNNQLSGSIPVEFGAPASAGKQVASVSALRSLQRLDLSQNRFSGAVPASLGTMTNLLELRLGGNQFSGTLPGQLIQLQRLKVLDASSNQLSDAPSFKDIARLDSLRLDGNAMSFSVLERQVGVRNFRYTPQQITPPALSDTSVVADMPFTLRAWIAGANNRYKWRKNGLVLNSVSANDSLGFAAFGAADSGRYSCEITNTALPLLSVTTASALVRVIPPSAVPGAVTIIAPVQGETEVPILPTLQWTTLVGAAQYRIEFSTSATLVPLLTQVVIFQSLSALASGVMEVDTRGLNGFPLQPEARYYWRVSAENARGSGPWAVGNFSTAGNTIMSAQRVDFGNVPRGDTSFATLNLRNQSSRSIRITDFITASNSAFVLSDIQNRNIPAESSVYVRVRFIPTTLNAINAGITVRFVAEGSTVVQTQTIAARLFGRGGALKLIAPATDTSVIGSTKLLAVQVVNVGDRELELVRVDLRRGAREYSFRASVDGRMPVGAGDTTLVLLKFVAEGTGSASSELIYCQANIDTVSIPLVQYGRLRVPSDVVAGIGVRTVPLVAAPGALVMVELFLTETTLGDRDKLFRSGAPYFTASLRMNRQVLVPDASGGALLRAVRNSIQGSTMQSYAVPTTFWNGRDSVLLRVPCRVVAGSTDVTPLVLEQLQWGNGSLQLTIVLEGKFTGAVSAAGGKRLIAPSGQTVAITAVAPNPAKEQVEITYLLPKDDFVTLTLIDARGNEVQRLMSEVQTAGQHKSSFKLGWLSSGSYMLRLETSTEMVTGRVEVVR